MRRAGEEGSRGADAPRGGGGECGCREWDGAKGVWSGGEMRPAIVGLGMSLRVWGCSQLCEQRLRQGAPPPLARWGAFPNDGEVYTCTCG